MKFSIKFSLVNATNFAVTFTEEILNGKLHFLCNDGSEYLNYFFTF